MMNRLTDEELDELRRDGIHHDPPRYADVVRCVDELRSARAAAAGVVLSEEERAALKWARAAMCASRSAEPGPVDFHIDALDRLLSARPADAAGTSGSGVAKRREESGQDPWPAQCAAVLPNDRSMRHDDGYKCCARDAGHLGPHRTGYSGAARCEGDPAWTFDVSAILALPSAYVQAAPRGTRGDRYAKPEHAALIRAIACLGDAVHLDGAPPDKDRAEWQGVHDEARDALDRLTDPVLPFLSKDAAPVAARVVTADEVRRTAVVFGEGSDLRRAETLLRAALEHLGITVAKEPTP